MITLPKADKARIRRLEAGEEQRLLIDANDQLQRIITLALETGMRRGEILNIKKSHIDLTLRTLFIPSTKTNEPRTIPLSSAAIASLRGQMRVSQRQSQGVISLHEPPFFAYKPRGVSGEFSKLCRRTGIDDFHFHDLRHEATSRLKFRIHPPFRRPQDQLFIYEADSRAIMQFIWLMLTGEWTDGW